MSIPRPRPRALAADTPRAASTPRTTLRIVTAVLLLAGAAAVPAQPAVADDAAARTALAAAELGRPAALPDAHPLAGWLEFTRLRRDIDVLPVAQAQAFLDRHQGQPVAEAFREAWLAALARRKDWPAFRAAWRTGVGGEALRCAELEARLATGATDAAWTRDAQALWRSGGKALPAACDAPFVALAAQGGLPPALRWERIDKAAAEWQPAVMRSAARGLPADEFALANDYAAFFEAVHDRALAWPKTARSRHMASHGLARLAKSVPASVDTQLPKFATALGLDEAERGRVLYQAALWAVASYEPSAARRLAAVPAVAYDERLHEWRVREAMARSDWPAALAAVRRMGDKQRGDSRWTYFQARFTELAGDKAAAQALYRDAARKPDFHGFLAADRTDQPYALCPWLPNEPASAKAAVAATPALRRAVALWRIDRAGWAQREWDAALAGFDDRQRRLAVEVAQDHGWFDRGVFGLVNVGGQNRPEELRLYKLRFPLHHEATIRREAARHRIDPAWVAAEIRAESVFNPRARSSANAMGLMQVLPGTGAGVARRLGLPWNGADSLYDPDTNIAIGTAYLREMEDKYGLAYLAIAAYNAGPAPVARWRSQRPGMDPDFWIETVSYKETREYIARVLAFSVIYDWRLDGSAVPVSDRMLGRTPAARKRFSCPLTPAG
jgi:soluble lytic murein transglycosylase